MCATCGCGDDTGVRVTAISGRSDQSHAGTPSGHDHAHGSEHPHPHRHDHDHPHGPRRSAATETIVLEQDVLAKNALRAARNRGWLEGRGITAHNLMSSPGSGKTTLLVRTIAELSGTESPIAVIEGDQETVLDAQRVRATGVPVVQINTGAGCHLDADMLHRGLQSLAPEPGTLLFIENVGNLVCPALFDLGEASRVVVISVTEGDDKPLKYPHMFASADLVVINKADLLPYVDFDVSACMRHARQLKPGLPYLILSAKTGDGLEAWYNWLKSGSNGRIAG